MNDLGQEIFTPGPRRTVLLADRTQMEVIRAFYVSERTVRVIGRSPPAPAVANRETVA